MKHAVISLSGGMDSSTLLLRCLKEYDTVTALSFDYGQKHQVEIERAQSLVKYLNDNPTRVFHHDHIPGGFEESYPSVNYRVIKLDGLVDLLNSALVQGGAEVPEGHYAEENMKATVVPNRNKIFASITQAVALSIADGQCGHCRGACDRKIDGLEHLPCDSGPRSPHGGNPVRERSRRNTLCRLSSLRGRAGWNSSDPYPGSR